MRDRWTWVQRSLLFSSIDRIMICLQAERPSTVTWFEVSTPPAKAKCSESFSLFFHFHALHLIYWYNYQMSLCPFVPLSPAKPEYDWTAFRGTYSTKTRDKTKKMGHWDNGTLGQMVFALSGMSVVGRQMVLYELLYILLIYILIIYIIILIGSFCPNWKIENTNVPLSHCPFVPPFDFVAIRQNSSKLGFCSRCSVIWLRRIPPCKA